MRTLMATVAACLAADAHGSPREDATFSGVDSNGVLGSPANQVRTFTPVGGYPVGSLRVTASLTKVHPETFASEARVRVTTPSGRTHVVQPFSFFDFEGTVAATDYLFAFEEPEPDAAGVWTLRFFEQYDDGGPAETDAAWDSFTIVLDDEGSAPPPDHTSAIDLGVLTPGAVVRRVDELAGVTRALRWYRFTLSEGVGGATPNVLDIDCHGTVHGDDVTDTEMAIFDAAGTLIAQDDDSGVGLWSVLSHGHDTRGGPFDGRHPDLPAGEYYVVIAPYNAAFGSPFTVSTTGASRSMRARLHLSFGADTTPGVSAPGAVDLGVLSPAGVSAGPVALGIDETVWFRFELAEGVSGINGLFLDIDTSGSDLSPFNDTEIALYDASGVRVASDDDDGDGFLSQLSFGSGSTSPPWGDSEPFDGRGGPLAAGVYYLAVSGHDTTHTSSAWLVWPASDEAGTVRVHLRTNTSSAPPCPPDFNGDGFLDFFDLDAFVACFEGEGCPEGRTGDYNGDEFIDFFDLDAFVADFEAGC
ncbi:MAG: hypothetical protein HRU70_00895 [Phycisphaeraceae bacterium]|nr:MAG: hypothetical protein HRU70_00895 [Phycisphaeraceae bacterium]